MPIPTRPTDAQMQQLIDATAGNIQTGVTIMRDWIKFVEDAILFEQNIISLPELSGKINGRDRSILLKVQFDGSGARLFANDSHIWSIVENSWVLNNPYGDLDNPTDPDEFLADKLFPTRGQALAKMKDEYNRIESLFDS